MNERIYSEALYKAVSGGMKLDAALSRLKEILKERGHDALYGKILRSAEARFRKDEGAGTLEVTVAKKGDEKAFKDEIANAKERFGATHTTIRIDESIAGGYIARTNDKEVDASYKSALLSIYRSLTS
jgi:F0F1-type ATP synthase delta subunit